MKRKPYEPQGTKHQQRNPTTKPTSRRPSSNAQHVANAASNATETVADLDRSQGERCSTSNRLRARHEGNHDFAFDTQIIADQPRLLIKTDDQVGMAGSSHWTGSHWQILLNADDHPLRRRFTLAHEYKHIIDHGTPVDPELEEKICDHFAACLLMPKQKVIATWTHPGIPQRVNDMAAAFAVSSQAMRYRLHELGLLERTYQRCGGVRAVRSDQSRKAGSESIYYRQTSAQLVRVA